MDKIRQYAGSNNSIVLRRVILFLLTICTYLAMCGCNTDDAGVSGPADNDGSQIVSNGGDMSGKEALPRENKKNALSHEDKNKELIDSGISLPLEKSMVFDFSIDSGYFGKKIRCKIYLPKGYGNSEPCPVWYGLHGYSSDESMWIKDTGVTEASDELVENGAIKPMIMVFPYTRDATIKEINEDLADDGKFGERNMDRFICEELVPYIDARYDTITSSDGRYIGGFSMGGMIALRVAFHHPDLFSKVGGYSAAVISDDYSAIQLEEWLYPYDGVDETTDVVDFSRSKGLDKLTVYLDCGTNNDPFLAGIQSLNEALQKRGIKSEFHMFNGGHDLAHTRAVIKDHLNFYAARH